MVAMKATIRTGLILVVLSVLLLVGASTGALAGECMSIGEISTQCGCPGGWYCG